MELKGKKVIILVEEMFNDQEFWYPYYRLKEAGVEVVVVGSGSAKEYTGKPGTQTRVDDDADKISSSEFDGIDRGRNNTLICIAPPSEPDWRFSRIRLSSRWFYLDEDWSNKAWAFTRENSPSS